MLVSDLPPWLIRASAFVFGALWGSFFNVAIYRWPRGMSVVSPPSHCPACGAPISPWRNIPLLGYVGLRGRAGCCGAVIPIRYPLVELIGAVLSVAITEKALADASSSALLGDALLEALVYFAFAGGLVVATFVDLEWMEIPDEVSLPGTALGLATASVRVWPGPEAAALGAGMGFLMIQLPFVWGYERILGRRGMGEGDSKLLMMIGAFVGWRGALFALAAGALQGVVAAAIVMIGGGSLSTPRRQEPSDDDPNDEDPDDENADDEDVSPGQLKVPFGPFLALAALEYFFWGESLIEWYLSSMRV